MRWGLVDNSLVFQVIDYLPRTLHWDSITLSLSERYPKVREELSAEQPFVLELLCLVFYGPFSVVDHRITMDATAADGILSLLHQ